MLPQNKYRLVEPIRGRVYQADQGFFFVSVP